MPAIRLPKMMIGFVVRRCTIELGHKPTPEEFAAWANSRGDGEQRPLVFGRAISEHEAHIILKHQSRLVSAKSARAEEQFVDRDELPRSAAAAENVVDLSQVRRRMQALDRAAPPRRHSSKL
jgi:hypothetical protein